MPAIRPDDMIAGTSHHGPCGPVRSDWISEAGGLTQFGAFIQTLPPGSSSSIKHWHLQEDEMVLVLSGEVTLIEGDAETRLTPGDAATFRAGVPVGHNLVNRSDADARYLVVGTRARRDRITYPDDDRILLLDRTGEGNAWTDHAGNPADNPYRA